MNRSKWKGLYITLNSKNPQNLSPIILMSRNSSVTPKHIGQTYKVHNGKNFKKITVIKEMVGHKFGEFFKTKADFTFKKKKK